MEREAERERLQKVLARAGVDSRRNVEDMIREGRVTVNGEVATLGDKANLEEDAVKVDGKRILPLRGPHKYILLNKPRGVLSTRDDPVGRPTVLDLIPVGMHKALVPVGRLDFDTEGLILLTDDGDFAQRVAHPRYGCTKTYHAKVKGEPTKAQLDKLREGIVLDGHQTAPVVIEPFSGPEGPRDTKSNTWWRVILGEGRTRQIREMFFRINHPVQRLRRVAIGQLHDPRLPRGEWRELKDVEVKKLLESTKGGRGSVEQTRKKRQASRRGADERARAAREKGRGGGGKGSGGKGRGEKGRGGRSGGKKRKGWGTKRGGRSGGDSGGQRGGQSSGRGGGRSGDRGKGRR